MYLYPPITHLCSTSPCSVLGLGLGPCPLTQVQPDERTAREIEGPETWAEEQAGSSRAPGMLCGRGLLQGKGSLAEMSEGYKPQSILGKR